MRRVCHRTTTPMLALVVAVAAACGGEAPAATRATVRDSAGIQIVENTAPAWPANAGWHLSTTPRVAIGVVEGDPHYQLDGVMNAVRLSDGRIVIANGGSNELRFYDSTGTFQSAAGRKGGGPGEFQLLRWLCRLPGDSLLVYDSRSSRLSVFDPRGHFSRGTTLQQTHGPQLLGFYGRFADGSIVMSVMRFAAPSAFPNGRVRTPVTYVRVGADGVFLDTLGSFPGGEGFFKSTATSVSVFALPLGRSASTAVYGDEFYYGSGDSYQIEVHAPDGALRRLIRSAQENRPVTDDVVEQMVQSALDAERERHGTVSADARAAIEKRFAEAGTPETMPAYKGFLVDVGGDLWVREFRPPGDKQPQRWTVFTPDGQLLGTVTMPDRFAPLDIGTDYVLGMWRDDLDVEHVQLYALVKPAPAHDDRQPIEVGGA